MTGPDTTTSAPPPPPPPAPTKRPLVRRRDDRMIAGVAGGVADHLGLDVTVVRVIWVLSVFAGGAGILAYIACALLIPEDGGATHHADDGDRGPVFWVGIGLIVLAGLALIDAIDIVPRGVGWGVVLIAIGIALWRVTSIRDERPPAPAWSATSHRPTETVDVPTSLTAQEAAVPTDTLAPDRGAPPPSQPASRAWSPPPARPRRQSSPLGRVTIAVALVVAGTVLSLDRAGTVDVLPVHVLGSALATIALGLLVGAFIGRARWLAAVGALLVPLTLVAGVAGDIGVPVRGGFGEQTIAPQRFTDLRTEYELGAGSFVLDLSALDFDGRPPWTLDVTVGLGEVHVTVPADVEVVVDASAAAGQIELFGRTWSGPDVAVSQRFPGSELTTGQLVLDLDAAFGQIVVERAAPTPTTEEPS